MSQCLNHDFYSVGKVSGEAYVTCCYCGQVRSVDIRGNVRIVVPEGRVRNV